MSKKPENVIGLPASKRAMTMTICGAIIFACSLLQLIFWKSILNMILEHAMVLSPSSKSFEVWKKPPITLSLDFYLFNWTNPENFSDPTIKPILQQVGPYRFIEKTDKVDIVWHTHNASVSYRRRSQFFFDESNSAGSLDDKLVTVNSLAVAIARTVKNWSLISRSVINGALGNHISIKKTANELLFGGYDDTVLSIGSMIPTSFFEFIVPFDKYGYCYGRNNSAEFYGPINIYTGDDDIQKIGRVHTWKHSRQTKANSEECNTVHGSMGEFQTPHLKENGTIEYFLPDLCRPMEMEYAQRTEIEGIKGFKYIGGEKAIDNGTKYPENKCYCNGECVPSGLMNVTACWYGSPIFMSYPHFYKADPYYLEQVEGLKPSKEEHELYLTLEPETGYLLDLGARLQTNILVEPLPLNMFKNVRRIFFPLFWLEEKTRITPELASELKVLPIVSTCGRFLGWLGLILGLVLCLWYPARQYWSQKMQHDLDGFDNQSVASEKKSKLTNSLSNQFLPPFKNCECETPESVMEDT